MGFTPTHTWPHTPHVHTSHYIFFLEATCLVITSHLAVRANCTVVLYGLCLYVVCFVEFEKASGGTELLSSLRSVCNAPVIRDGDNVYARQIFILTGCS